MTDKEWTRIQMYLPERGLEDIVNPDQLFHEVIVGLADVSEQALVADSKRKNATKLLSIADACDQLIACVIDMMTTSMRDVNDVREWITEEQAITIKRHGPPEERSETMSGLVHLLAEEVGEVAQELQMMLYFADGVAGELAQVASVALTIRRVAVHRAGVNW